MARIENTTPHNMEPMIKVGEGLERLVIPRGSMPGLGDPNGFVDVSDEVATALQSEDWFQVLVARGELVVVSGSSKKAAKAADVDSDDKSKGRK